MLTPSRAAPPLSSPPAKMWPAAPQDEDMKRGSADSSGKRTVMEQCPRMTDHSPEKSASTRAVLQFGERTYK